MKTKIFFLGVALSSLCSVSHALETITGHVTFVEPTYLPGAVIFKLDVGNTTCPAGTPIKWQKTDMSNNKAVYATLMVALVANKQVAVFINDGDTTCNGQYLHLYNS